MAEVEKIKRKSKSQSEGDGKLYKEALSKKPTFNSDTEALASATRELETLAQRHGQTVETFLATAESSSKFNEDYLEGLTLARRIARFF